MGYRGNVITQHREYGASIFCDIEQFEKYLDKLYDLYSSSEIYQSETTDYFEIEKEVIEKEIKRLTELGRDKEFEFQSSYSGKYKETNGEIANNLQTALDESPKDSCYVSLEWY